MQFESKIFPCCAKQFEFHFKFEDNWRSVPMGGRLLWHFWCLWGFIRWRTVLHDLPKWNATSKSISCSEKTHTLRRLFLKNRLMPLDLLGHWIKNKGYILEILQNGPPQLDGQLRVDLQAMPPHILGPLQYWTSALLWSDTEGQGIQKLIL